MKRHLLTAVVALGSLSAIAQSTTNKVSAPITATPDTLFSNMVQNSSVSLLTGIERANVDSDALGTYLNLSLNSRVTDDISITFQVRSSTADIGATSENPYKLGDTRLFINAFNTEVSIAGQDITIAPQVRLQPHTTSAASQGDLATLRVGATASTAINEANTFSVSAYMYDELTDSTADSSVSGKSGLYTVVDNTYAMNDVNSLSLTYEHLNAIDQTRNLLRSSGKTVNDLWLTYANSSIESVRIAPYLVQHLEDTMTWKKTTFGVDASYTF